MVHDSGHAKNLVSKANSSKKVCVLVAELIEYWRRSYSGISRMQYYVGI